MLESRNRSYRSADGKENKEKGQCGSVGITIDEDSGREGWPAGGHLCGALPHSLEPDGNWNPPIQTSGLGHSPSPDTFKIWNRQRPAGIEPALLTWSKLYVRNIITKGSTNLSNSVLGLGAYHSAGVAQQG